MLQPRRRAFWNAEKHVHISARVSPAKSTDVLPIFIPDGLDTLEAARVFLAASVYRWQAFVDAASTRFELARAYNGQKKSSLSMMMGSFPVCSGTSSWQRLDAMRGRARKANAQR